MIMTDTETRMTISDDTAWAAVKRRDRDYDGLFVTGVLTTGIYCRPSCAARHPLRENVRFFADGEAARAIGLRACKRCLPDDVSRDEQAIATALRLLAGEEPPRLEELAERVGYSPTHFSRVFARAVGLTPAAYVRGLKAQRAVEAIEHGASVTEAIYEGGFSAPSRFYEAMKSEIPMQPSAWKKGGEGVTIRWAIAETSLGKMLLAATDKGICRLSFDEDESELARRFPNANLLAGDGDFGGLLEQAIAAVEHPENTPKLPLDVGGTAFQRAVWDELQRIPAGETRTYADIAAAAGKPKAVRAAGTANGANNVAVLIPCHRVIRTDGTLGGYAYGLARKQALLDAEGVGE